MRVAVAIMPGLFMSVVAAGREEFVQHRGKIFLQARFKFNAADGPSAANVEDVSDARAQAGFADNPSYLIGEVEHVTMTRGLDLEFALVNHSRNVIYRTLRAKL